jgi:DnaJ-class molecular chaperone
MSNKKIGKEIGKEVGKKVGKNLSLPCLCPVCKGHGFVEGSFYNTKKKTEECRACNGIGIIKKIKIEIEIYGDIDFSEGDYSFSSCVD